MIDTDPFLSLPLFQGFTPQQLDQLRPLFMPVDAYADTLLFEQGAMADYFYLVVSGEVVISYKPYDGPPINIARVRPGGVVGWSAALGGRFYTSTAQASTYTQMLRVRGADLRTFYRQHPRTGKLILERLACIIAERLRSTYEAVYELLKQGLHSGVHSA